MYSPFRLKMKKKIVYYYYTFNIKLQYLWNLLSYSIVCDSEALSRGSPCFSDFITLVSLFQTSNHVRLQSGL